MTAFTLPADRSIRVDGLRRTVSDLRRSIDFYCDALGFERSGDVAPTEPIGARVRLGAQHIDLVVRDPSKQMATPANAPDPRFQHAAIVSVDIDASWRRLEAHAVVAISKNGPQRLPANAGGVTAFKFRDPDGHPLELIEFPAGVGDPRWQIDAGRGPTIGIDHFALVVEAIDTSTSFFAEQLGFRVAGRGINRGVGQDRLDGIEGVEVDVLSIEPPKGPRTPHIELLRYRHPALVRTIDGRGTSFHGNGDEIVCLGERCVRAGPGAFRLCDPDGHRFVVDT
jgi:catechol 2,3-dioxygenase-like lactoylglutathione lyase family enzyme